PNQGNKPDTNPSSPANQGNKPDTNPSSPPNQGNKPDTNPSSPPNQGTDPDANPSSPPNQGNNPEANPSSPPNQSTEPEDGSLDVDDSVAPAPLPVVAEGLSSCNSLISDTRFMLGSSSCTMGEKLNFEMAYQFCRRNGRELVSVESLHRNRDLNSFLLVHLPALLESSTVMIGLNYRSSLSKFRWIDGSTSVYRDWCSNQPNLENGLCIGFQINPSGTEDRGCFKSIDCDEIHDFVCQLPGVDLKKSVDTIKRTLTKVKKDCHRCRD
uniref:C-type lectin domain-containing protein n=1 Tax=Clytia hemisphaerica TaxID=252671 RepID=A0A7M5XI52_9CNID